MLPRDDLRAFYWNPIFAVGHVAVIIGGFVVVEPRVYFAAENARQIPICEPCTTKSYPAIIKRFDDPAAAAPLLRPIEDLPHDRSLGRHDFEFHSPLFIVDFSNVRFETIWHAPTVPKAVASVSAPTLARVDSIIKRTLFVEYRGECLAHPLRPAFTKVFGYADHLNASFCKGMDGVDKQMHVAGKSRLPVDQYDLDWPRRACRVSNHAIKLRALTERATQTVVDIFADDFDPVPLGILPASVTLGLNRVRVAALVIDGQAQI